MLEVFLNKRVTGVEKFNSNKKFFTVLNFFPLDKTGIACYRLFNYAGQGIKIFREHKGGGAWNK